VREVRAHVLDAEHVDEELGELVRRRRPVDADARVVRTDARHARPARRDDRVVAGEDLAEAARERGALALVPGVEVHLPATGLVHRELDGHAEAVEQRHSRLADVGIERVGQARDEEGRLHATTAAADASMDVWNTTATTSDMAHWT
jgi:hypothetical protein